MFERYYPELLSFLFVELKDPEAARDIAQETYARVLGFSQAKTEIRAPRALLYSTARNLMVDLHRRNRLRNHDDLEQYGHISSAPCEQPEQRAASRQRIEGLLAAVADLPPRCREAFVLHKFKGLSQADVAKRMGISVNMVERHLIRAMLACRQVGGGEREG